MTTSQRSDAGGETLEDALRSAAELAEDGRAAEAFEQLVEWDDQAPEDSALLCMLGALARDVGADGPAYDYFRRCLATNPADPTVLATAGQGVAAFDDPDAETALRAAALTGPHLVLTRLTYGAYLAREGMMEEALGELEAARDLAPDDGLVRFELATALYLDGQRTEAVPEMELAAELREDDGWIGALLGMTLWMAGREEEGAEQLHRVGEELRSEDGELHLFAALAFAGLGWLDEAWNAHARAESVPRPPDQAVIREVEVALEAGEEAARTLLRQELAPGMIRERLLQRA